MAENPARVGIYTRISEDRDGQQTATARQLEDCRAFAARRQWEVADVFEDVDTSAFNTRVKRPQFERMIEALRSGDIDGVIVWKLDRLSRQQRDLGRVIEACEPRKAFIASVTEPIDTRETYGQFVAELLVAQARMESANTSARLKRKAREQREQGLPPTNGKRCFGYDRGYTTIIAEEASVLREVRDRLFAGDSLNGIAVDLEARGVVGTLGNAWRPHILKRLLVSPTIAGARVQDGKLLPGTWEPIISVEDSRRLNTLLNRTAGGSRERQPRHYYLTGLLRCGRCGGRLTAQARRGGVPTYVCKKEPGNGHCGSLSAKGEPIEILVREMVIAAVDDEALATALAASGAADLTLVDAIRSDELALEELSRDFYVDKLISREEFLAARTELARRLEQARERLAKQTRGTALGAFVKSGEALRRAWEEGTLEWRRSVTAALLDHIVVHPGAPGRRPFDPERIQPVWKY
jgi:site-specific DNA recombinase